MAAMAGTAWAEARIQELHVGLPHGYKGPKYLDPVRTLFTHEDDKKLP